MKRPQVWVQLEPEDKDLLDQLAARTNTSASALGGMWVRLGLCGAFSSAEGLPPEEKVLMDRLVDLAARLSTSSTGDATARAMRLGEQLAASRARLTLPPGQYAIGTHPDAADPEE